MSDIVERLRAAMVNPLGREAADEIERLHDSVIDLRALVSDLNAEIERLNAGEAAMGADHGRAS